MPYIRLLLISLLFVGCITTNETKPTADVPTTDMETTNLPTSSLPVSLPTTLQSQDDDDLNIAIEPENTIVGKYRLKNGAFSYGAIHQTINEGYLVIEELDVNDYGYYYVTIVNKMSPETHSGIFYEKGGKFVQKVIYDQGDENSTRTEITTIDNIDITYDENILKIIIDSNKKETTVWERDDGITEKSEKVKKALKEAEYEYYKFYKEKCDAAKVKCSEHAYTPVND